MNLKRFGVSLEEDLLATLDEIVKSERFPNRSQAIRFLVRQYESRKKWEANADVAGAIVLVYDHHKRSLSSQTTSLQHEYHCLVLAVQHIHLNEHNCIEIIAVRGRADRLIKLADKLKALKGVKSGQLMMTAMD